MLLFKGGFQVPYIDGLSSATPLNILYNTTNTIECMACRLQSTVNNEESAALPQVLRYDPFKQMIGGWVCAESRPTNLIFASLGSACPPHCD